MKFYTILFVVAVASQVYCDDNCKDAKLDSYYGKNEERCSAAGGRCIFKDQCEQLASESGLCPEQQSKGFECCYSAPKDEYRCKEFGGECFNLGECKRPDKRGQDCGDKQECCILM